LPQGISINDKKSLTWMLTECIDLWWR